MSSAATGGSPVTASSCAVAALSSGAGRVVQSAISLATDAADSAART